MRVELRYSGNVTYLFPALVTLFAALFDIATSARLLIIAAAAALTWLHCWMARAAYEGLITQGALRAARYAGATQANARVSSHGAPSLT